MEIRNINSAGYFSVEAFYRQQGYGGGIKDSEQVFAAYVSGKLVGAAKLESLPGSDQVLRGVYVSDLHRGLGIGGALVQHVVSQRVGALYCLPKLHLENWYQSFGFQLVVQPAMSLPSLLRQRMAAYQDRQINVLAMRVVKQKR